MIKINEECYQIEKQDMIDYLTGLNPSEKISLLCSKNWLNVKIVRKFCEDKKIHIPFSSFLGSEEDIFLFQWMKNKYKDDGKESIYTAEQILTYFNQK